MRGSITVILITAIILSGMQLSVAANPDPSDRKVYHNEKWDLLLLYPEDWNYIEEFGDNVPVIMHPPKDEESEGFIMFYYSGEGIAEDIDELTDYFEEDVLGTYDSYEMLSVEDSETKEGFVARDLHYSFSDHNQDFISNTRLIITDDDASWAIIFDRPPDCAESVVNEGLKIIDSIIFSAAEYLSHEEEG